jgi:hypothetical protein
MTFFDYFCQCLRAQLIIPEEVGEQIGAGFEGLSPEESLAQLEDAEANLEILLSEPKLENLREPSSDQALLFISTVIKLGLQGFIDTPTVERVSFAVAFANNLDEEAWEAEWNQEDTSIQMFEVADGTMDPVYSLNGTATRLRSFLHEGTGNHEASIAVLDLRDEAEISQFGSQESLEASAREILTAAEAEHCSEIISEIVSALLSYRDRILDSCHIFSSSTDDQKRTAYLKYQLVLRGYVLTLPIPARTQKDLDSISKSISPNDVLKQYLEPFSMMAEINSRSTLIEVYLSTYHVLENYMIRTAIAATFRNGGGNGLARSRDIKRLSSSLNDAEKSHLKKLFQASWPLTIGGQTLEAFAKSTVTKFAKSNLKNATNHQAFSDWMKKFDSNLVLFPDPKVKPKSKGKPKAKATLDLSSITPESIAFLIYNVRNTIVHNKETEFHLSNRELLDPMCKLILDELCIPIMQRLAFGLPSVTGGTGAGVLDNPIEYGSPHLALY